MTLDARDQALYAEWRIRAQALESISSVIARMVMLYPPVNVDTIRELHGDSWRAADAAERRAYLAWVDYKGGRTEQHDG